MGGSIEEFHDKAAKKKLRNRLSAQRARDRQKARMRQLDTDVRVLMRKNLHLLRENEMMRRSLASEAGKSNNWTMNKVSDLHNLVNK